MKHLLPRSQLRLLSQLRSNPYFLEDDDDDDTEDFPDLHIAYRRPDLEKCTDKCQHDDDNDLSDYVLVRLALARAKALQRYHEAQPDIT